MTDNSKWVACWGTATSITNRREAIYAKDLTLRYPIRMCFSGTMLRFRFSNLTGTEPVTLNKVFVGHTPITFGGETSVTLSDECNTYCGVGDKEMTVYSRVVASCTGQRLQLGCQHIAHSHRIHLNQFGIQFTKLTSEVLSVLLHLTDEVFARQIK